MAEELQQLLEKIQRDGVDKANAEAAAIVAKAKAEADALVKAASLLLGYKQVRPTVKEYFGKGASLAVRRGLLVKEGKEYRLAE